MDDQVYAMTKPGCVPKLIDCFSDQEELIKFVGQLYSGSLEIVDYCELATKETDRDVITSKLILSLVTHLLFVRQNYDIIRDLVSKLDVEFINKSELNKMQDKLNFKGDIFD